MREVEGSCVSLRRRVGWDHVIGYFPQVVYCENAGAHDDLLEKIT